MGKIVEMTGQKKKKGRPSLLDLQKRELKLKQQHREEEQKNNPRNQQLKRTHIQFQNPNTTPIRRSSRRDLNPDPNSPHDEVDSAAPSNSGSDSKDNDVQSSSRSHKRRKVETIEDGSEQKGKKQGASANQAVNSRQEVELDDDGPSTPLPDKTLLLFILDRLQKKDTYGVFAEPVDPEELPDYHEVIDHPMDFNTIRNNLKHEVYKNLEQFERDVFLLCSNAMQYNAPGTVYFRQARAIQELANKNFEDLRQDSGSSHEQEPKIAVKRRGRPPTKHLKKSEVDRGLLERANSNYAEMILASRGENTSLDIRKAPTSSEVYISWSGDKYDGRTNDIAGSMPKYILLKHGKEQIILDENRRNTYKLLSSGPPATTRQDQSVLLTFCGVRKQLLPVGIHSTYGYARSLAQFAAKLGPVAWKIASKKIETCLPAGVKFGPAWVGENDAQHQTSSNLIGSLECNTHKLSQQVVQPPLKCTADDLPVCSNAMDCGTSPPVTGSSGIFEEGETCRSQAASVASSGLSTQAQTSSLAGPSVIGNKGITPSSNGAV